MKGDETGGGARPPQPAQIDVDGRWNLFLAKRTDIEKAFRETLNLPADMDLSLFAQPFAMAAVPALPDPVPPRRPGRATPQQVRRALLRIETTARGAIQSKPRKNAVKLLRMAINDAPDEVKAALPSAIMFAAMLPGADDRSKPPFRESAPEPPPRSRIERLAADAGAIAATIPPSKHPGGRQPAKIDETALAIRLAKSYEMLTGNKATVSNFDLGKDNPRDSAAFMLLIDCVFAIIGLKGSARKAAERAVAHLTSVRSRAPEIVEE